MTTTRSRSHTLALRPNFSWKIPIVPGPQTSWVMRMSTFTQTFSPGVTWLLAACLERIFSVMVMPGIEYALISTDESDETYEYSGTKFCGPSRDGGVMRRALMGLAIVLGCQMGDVALAADKSWAEILGAPKGEIPAPQPSVRWRLDVGDAMKFAQAENRPLFVTMRCLPCKQCSAFDKNVF